MIPLVQRLKPYLGMVVLSLVLVLVQALGELGLPTLMAGIIDKGVLGKDPGAVVSGGAWMLLVAFVSAGASVTAAWVTARLGAGFGRDLRAAVFRKTTDLPVGDFDRFGAASLITRTTNDVVQVQGFLVMGLRMLVAAPLMAIGGLVMAFSLDRGLALVLLVVIPVLALAIVLVALRGVTFFRQVQKKIDRLNQVLRESLTGVRVIRAFDRQEFDADRFRTANFDLADVSLKTQKLMAVVMPGMMFAMSASSVALVWFGGLRIQAGDLQVGGLMAFLQYATQILFSLMMLSMLFVIMPRAAVSAGRINDVLGVPDPDQGVRGADRGPESSPQGARIEFRNVTFRYPGAEQAALEGVSFTAAPGAVTALIGGTGSGKTTVLQLVARFHDATEGQVLVDGLDVKLWDRRALRRRLGISPQRARLFTGTVAENLRWGDPRAGDEALREAAGVAQAAEFVEALPDRWENRIDKAGANLSGGQKQRLAIARALVRRPAALLFDDSFSALDFKTDAALRSALRARKDRSTVLLVAQRVATVRDADRIVVLDEGRVAGVGTHAELAAGNPVYQEIVASQEGREEHR
jgi:ATP-binding cassette subfamily B protein